MDVYSKVSGTTKMLEGKGKKEEGEYDEDEGESNDHMQGW
jgi:hypothetical protein